MRRKILQPPQLNKQTNKPELQHRLFVSMQLLSGRFDMNAILQQKKKMKFLTSSFNTVMCARVAFWSNGVARRRRGTLSLSGENRRRSNAGDGDKGRMGVGQVQFQPGRVCPKAKGTMDFHVVQ